MVISPDYYLRWLRSIKSLQPWQTFNRFGPFPQGPNASVVDVTGMVMNHINQQWCILSNGF